MKKTRRIKAWAVMTGDVLISVYTDRGERFLKGYWTQNEGFSIQRCLITIPNRPKRK